MLKSQTREQYKEFFDQKLLKFIIVGVINTGFSAVIMMGLYNICGMGYWGASALSYILGSVLSFFLNKYFTFSNKSSLRIAAVKFSLNVAVCYVIAYGLAKPGVKLILGASCIVLSKKDLDFIAMACGMFLFTLLNYIGQRYFTFKDKKMKQMIIK